MPLLGTAAVAMWWDIAPEQRVEFEDWHCLRMVIFPGLDAVG
jgi:hypothetical protein